MKITLEDIKNMIIEAMESYQGEVDGVSHDTMADNIESVKEEEKPKKKKKNLKSSKKRVK